MRRTWLVLMLAMMVVAFADAAYANQIVVTNPLTMYNGNGGPFIATIDGGAQFTTFCLEENEVFTPGHTYTFNVNNAAVLGGVGGGSPDLLDDRSAYLYSKFIAGKYTAGQLTALQAAIWTIEGEITSINPGELVLATKMMNEAAFVVNHGWQNNGSVVVLNLLDGTTNAQDMIKHVPEPGTLLLLGSGLLGLSGVVLRRRKN